MKHTIKIALAFLITASCAWGMDENKKREKKVKKIELFDFSTLDVKKIEEKTGLDLSEWTIEPDDSDFGYPILSFFDKRRTLFGSLGYVFYSANTNKFNTSAHIVLKTIVITEKYRRTDLSKLVWTKLVPYFLESCSGCNVMVFDIQPMIGKYSIKNRQTRDELYRNLFKYYRSLTACVDEEKCTGIIYLDKLQEQLKKFKNS